MRDEGDVRNNLGVAENTFAFSNGYRCMTKLPRIVAVRFHFRIKFAVLRLNFRYVSVIEYKI